MLNYLLPHVCLNSSILQSNLTIYSYHTLGIMNYQFATPKLKLLLQRNSWMSRSTNSPWSAHHGVNSLGGVRLPTSRGVVLKGQAAMSTACSPSVSAKPCSWRYH